MFSAIEFSYADSPKEVLQSKGITLSTCRMVLAQHVFPLLMKPAGDLEGVGEFFKLFFILTISINGLLDS